MLAPPDIELVKEKCLLGRKLHTTIGAEEIQEQWKIFVTDLVQLFGSKPTEFYAVHEYGPFFNKERRYTTWATVPYDSYIKDSIPCSEIVIEQGLYAVFTHYGTISTFHKTLHHIHKHWLPASGYVIDHRKHFDYMGPKYLGPHNPLSQEKIYIPVKKLNE